VGGRLVARAEGVKARGEKSLESMKRGPLLVAIAAGVVLGATTPFQMAAIGVMVRDGYSLPVQLALVVGFSLLTYIVVDVPVLSYMVRPDATATRVAALSAWLDANKIRAAAALAAVGSIVPATSSHRDNASHRDTDRPSRMRAHHTLLRHPGRAPRGAGDRAIGPRRRKRGTCLHLVTEDASHV
jgi:hypothetical protein